MKDKMTNWVSKILPFQDTNDMFDIISKHTATQTNFLAEVYMNIQKIS